MVCKGDSEGQARKGERASEREGQGHARVKST